MSLLKLRIIGAETEPGKDFPGQLDDEKVFLFKRRHKFTLFKDYTVKIFIVLFLVAVPIVFKYIGNRSITTTKGQIASFEFFHTILNSGWFWLIYIIVMVTMFSTFYATYYNWKHDLYIITNQRVVDYNRFFPFKTRITEADLDRIQDSQIKVQGLWANLLDYGSIHIETAAEISPFNWSGIPNVDHARRSLKKAQAEYKENRRKHKKNEEEDYDDEEDEGL
jgi:uncharacterized membrane protein YdbT with pleckstrin-like domain